MDKFNIEFYRKSNKDLSNLDDSSLIKHYEEIGQYQMRLYYPVIFKREQIFIFSIKIGYYLALTLQYLLFKNCIMSTIIYKINPKLPNLHIILFSQKVTVFPKKYIIYQLEQKDISNWVDAKYKLGILNSYKTWDYSQSNINKFGDKIKSKMIFFPIPLVPYNYLNYKLSKDSLLNSTSNNLLFYGSINNDRRKKLNYLQQKLSPKYKIKIISDLSGEDLFKEILKSKIILNIHYYKGAILETYRINEVLSCGKLVISEKPDPIDNDNYELYKDKIVFIDNIEEMYEKIIYYLNNNISINNIYTTPYFTNSTIIDLIS